MSDLPKGWSLSQLSDVIKDIQPGFASGKKDVKDGLPHLRMNNIGIDGRLNLALLRRVPKEFAKEHHYLKQGDVLVCTTNSGKLVGKSALFKLQGKFSFSNHLTRLRVEDALIDSSYLQSSLFLLWQEVSFELLCKHWVNQSTIHREQLLSLEIPLPPLNEQRRIVKKLENLLHKVDDCKERLDKIPIILKRFRQTVLSAACSGRLTADWREKNRDTEHAMKFLKKITNDKVTCAEDENLPSTWCLSELQHCIESMANGIYKPEKYYASDGVISLRMYNIQDGKIIWQNLKRMSLTKHEVEQYRLKEGDILVNRVNSRELVGKAAIIQNLKEHVIFESKNIRLRLLKNSLLPEYVNYCFMTRIVRNVFEDKSKQTVGMATISQPQIASLQLPIPPLLEQKEVVRRVEALFKKADEIEARYKKATAFVDRLTQSLLAKAFRGELVPQDPNDEPASVLLEKIKAEKGRLEEAKKIGGGVENKGRFF